MGFPAVCVKCAPCNSSTEFEQPLQVIRQSVEAALTVRKFMPAGPVLLLRPQRTDNSCRQTTVHSTAYSLSTDRNEQRRKGVFVFDTNFPVVTSVHRALRRRQRLCRVFGPEDQPAPLVPIDGKAAELIRCVRPGVAAGQPAFVVRRATDLPFAAEPFGGSGRRPEAAVLA